MPFRSGAQQSGANFARDGREPKTMSNETSKSALLVMDVQAAILDRVPDKDAYLVKVKAAVAAARHQQMRVIFVVVGFRAGAPEASDRFKPMAPQLVDP